MRFLPASLVAALVAVATGLPPAGCVEDQGPSGRPAPLFSAGGNGTPAPRGPGDLYRLQVLYLTERTGPGAEAVDFWRFLDETVLPPSARSLLAANGLRMAVGGEMAREQLDRAVAANANVSVERAGDIFAYEGYALDVPHGAAQDDIALLYARRDGTVGGGDLGDASAILRFQCLAAAQPDTTDVYVSEWILHGRKQPRYRRTPTGWVEGQERPRFWFDDLKTTVPLREGQILVVGLEPGHPLSIGDHLFAARAEPYTVVTTIVLAPQLVAPGAVPPGARVVGQPDAGDAGTPGPSGANP